MTLPDYFSVPTDVNVQHLRRQAEELFLSGHYYCSEAVVKIIRDTFCPSVPDTIIAAASGFPIGMGGGGCTCGAVSGGVIALGLVFGRTKPDEKMKSAACMKYARELHDRFKAENKAVCCRILTKRMLDASDSGGHEKQCAELTAEVVEIVAEIILREAKA